MNVGGWVCVLDCGCPQRPEQSVESSAAIVAGGCELPYLNVRNQMRSSAGAARTLSY